MHYELYVKLIRGLLISPEDITLCTMSYILIKHVSIFDSLKDII